MELKHLLAYTTVVRLGSFSRAAEKLYIAQPTISLHVRQLEDELGTQLLIRTTKSIEVTEKGREVYEYAVSILQLKDRIAESCSDRGHQVIRLGASTIPSAYILPDVLPAYAKLHPSTYFTIDQGDSRTVAGKVAEGVIDIGLIGMKPDSPDIDAEPFCEDTVVIITPVCEPFLTMKEKGGATLQKLFEAPVILREEGSGSLKAADMFLRNAGYQEKDLHVAARINDPEAIKNMVVKGLGISMISSLAAENYSRENRLLVFTFPDIAIRRQFYLATGKHAVISENKKSFLRYLRQYFASPEQRS